MSKNVFLRIENLCKIYTLHTGAQKRALESVSFELYEGQIISLLGVNGAGKTTLSSIIATLHPPTSGDIVWNGSSLFKNIIEYRKIVGFCPQKVNLDPFLTLEEKIS
jgi:ABC-2 type transport system ATP-binding protein